MIIPPFCLRVHPILYILCIHTGWPIVFNDVVFQSSPVLYDHNHDGIDDILTVTRDASIHWILLDHDANYIKDYILKISPLRIKKDW